MQTCSGICKPVLPLARPPFSPPLQCLPDMHRTIPAPVTTFSAERHVIHPSRALIPPNRIVFVFSHPLFRPRFAPVPKMFATIFFSVISFYAKQSYNYGSTKNNRTASFLYHVRWVTFSAQVSNCISAVTHRVTHVRFAYDSLARVAVS